MKSVIGAADGKFKVINSDGFDGLYTKYTVVRGDTLGKIAKDNETTVDFLAKVNDIKNVDLIEVDQVLLIPVKGEVESAPVPGRKKSVIGAGNGLFKVINSDGFDGLYSKYTVVKGDTLGKIAKDFGTTVDFLAKVNDIKNVNLIEIDQVLLIPAKEEEKKEKAAGPAQPLFNSNK